MCDIFDSAANHVPDAWRFVTGRRRRDVAGKTQQEFETLLQAHRGIVFKTVNTYCWRQEDRGDLAQEIAAQLWKAWPKYDSSRNFTTWMYRIALNVAISFVREEVKHRRVFTSLAEDGYEATPVPDPGTTDRMERLHRFIEREPPFERALLLLYLEDRSQKEIAEILGITPTNVSTKISRLKQRIRTEI
nr:sigma-70 family RNA polymerase sigma factor [Edaphobacter lichenicola]